MRLRLSSIVQACCIAALAASAGCAGSGTAAPQPPAAAGIASAGASRATSPGGFTGSWPFTVTKSKYNNGNHCAVLTDYSSGGWKYSGTAIVDGKFRGSFAVIGTLIEITVDDGGYSQNAGSVYSGMVHKGAIGGGAFVEVYGGAAFDQGKIAFGKRGGC